MYTTYCYCYVLLCVPLTVIVMYCYVYHLLLLFHLRLANLPTITVVVLCYIKFGRLLRRRCGD